MSQGQEYNEDYFMRGIETGKSLYTQYSWMPELTIPMAAMMVAHLGIKPEQTILDFGCARGYVVKALRSLGYIAYGYDVSQWAIDNCDPEVGEYLTVSEGTAFGVGRTYDWIIAKDVLEHIPEVRETVDLMMSSASAGVFVVVPLSATDGGRYVIRSYEEDKTHIHRFPLEKWVRMFLRPGWRVEASYRVPGIKDNYWRADYQWGNGFLVARRCE